ncbi:hypothetical protein [Halarcobacter ebronensis]|uniref:Uncharacterized protein n=1 Tax=Halarcobacter ebronensis TaxID=1462615 RepID=A0A4Q1AR20_9BACT|nr:hypothetical protein [Halarcobacter ebronensis]QKF82408.1 hypothetical protein AEBR_1928 [Halarcobacter ebronensis]RXK07569.1 hypothetical protein CRV07_03660 [Halarcobacter ebronensis]
MKKSFLIVVILASLSGVLNAKENGFVFVTITDGKGKMRMVEKDTLDRLKKENKSNKEIFEILEKKQKEFEKKFIKNIQG